MNSPSSSDVVNNMCNNGCSSSSNSGEGATSNSASSHEPGKSPSVSPEMLYKLSKKIAQLTKVIYSLNTRNDDLSLDMENMKVGYEDKMVEAHLEIQRLQERNGAVNGSASNSLESEQLLSSNESLKKELNKARNSLKNMETKMAEREEENRQMIESLNTMNTTMINGGGDHHHPLTNGIGGRSTNTNQSSKTAEETTTLKEKVSMLMKEKADLIRKLDRRDIMTENLKLERESLLKEVKDLNEGVSSLNLELSAARVELSYRDKAVGREDSEFTEELIRRIEELTTDKSNMVAKLEETHLIQVQQRSQIDDQKAVIQGLESSLDREKEVINELNAEILRVQNEAAQSSEDPREIVERVTKELQTQHETTLLDSKKFYEKEIKDLQESLASSQASVGELEGSLGEVTLRMGERGEEIESLKGQMTELRREFESSLKEARESTLEDCQKELEEAKSRSDKRIKEIQSENELQMEELKRNIVNMTSKGEELKVRFRETESVSERKEAEYREKIGQLEEALEQALAEREEILLAAGDEIQNEKDIALAIEQRLMDDFEWKLREIEREHRTKLEELKSEADNQIQVAKDSINRNSDESFTKLSIDLHRNMDEKLKAERNSLKLSYDEQSNRDKETVYARAKVEFDREKRALEASFGDERTKLEREIRALKRRVDDFPNELSRAISAAKKETEKMEEEGNIRLAMLQEQNQREIQGLKTTQLAELSQTKAELQDRINDLESRLRASDGHRLDSLFQVREDVEVEFAEKMETLRDMYMGEVEKESNKVSQLAAKLSQTESKLAELNERQRREIDELNTYIAHSEEEHETKVNELLTRLQEQTTLAVRLQEEIDEYDWYIEDEEGNITERNPNERPPSAAGVHRVNSRPSSTRPFARGGSTLTLNSDVREEEETSNPPVRMSAAVLATEEEDFLEEEEEEEPREEAAASEPSAVSYPNNDTYANPLRYLYL